MPNSVQQISNSARSIGNNADPTNVLIVLFNISDLEMCVIDDRPNGTFTEAIGNLCYHTGKTMYEVKKHFSEAVKEYVATYTALNENLRDYKKQWDTLGDNFYE